MSLNKMEVNEYIQKLLHSRAFLKKEILRYYDNNYTIEDVEGVISPEMLHQVIVQAKWSKKLRMLLEGILWYADKSSVTDNNFQLLCKFPGKYRNTYLDILGHIVVSFYQMEIINHDSPTCWEAFCWLFDQIIQNEFFTEYDMERLLKQSTRVGSFELRYSIEQAEEQYGWSKKVETAKKFLAVNATGVDRDG